MRLRCSPTDDRDEACATYSAVLSSFSFMMVHPEIVAEGGRLLAGRCLAGKGTAEGCSGVEKHLQAGSAERAAVAKVVDQRFEQACASGDSATCERGFFRKWGPDMNQETATRLARLAQVSGKGCVEGSPVICVEAGLFIASYGNAKGIAYAADLFGAACQLPPKAGERDVKQGSCDIEKKLREKLASGQ